MHPLGHIIAVIILCTIRLFIMIFQYSCACLLVGMVFTYRRVSLFIDVYLLAVDAAQATTVPNDGVKY